MLSKNDVSFNFNFEPRAVVETRWNKATMRSDGYVAEVMFGDSQYVLSGLLETHEEALKVATTFVENMKASMLNAGLQYVKNLREALRES